MQYKANIYIRHSALEQWLRIYNNSLLSWMIVDCSSNCSNCLTVLPILTKITYLSFGRESIILLTFVIAWSCYFKRKSERKSSPFYGYWRNDHDKKAVESVQHLFCNIPVVHSLSLRHNGAWLFVVLMKCYGQIWSRLF